MLQFIMDRNLLLYLLAAACVVGVASQMILKQIYEKLIRDTKNTGEPDGRFLQQLRQRFQYCTHLNEKVGDVRSFIQRSVMEYRFWGMSLHSWRRLGVECLVVSLLCALGGNVYLMRGGASFAAGNAYLWMGILAAALTAAAYGISDTGYQKEYLEVRLTDYLENSGAVRDYSEANDGMQEAESSSPIISVETGRKAGVQETAASAQRERNAELLRQMQPEEQERILREVLKEFLS